MSCPVCRKPTPEMETLGACPACGRRLNKAEPAPPKAARGQKTCLNCGKVFAEDFGTPKCPACKASLETGRLPSKPAKAKKFEFTEDSPIWESGKELQGFVARAVQTGLQFITRPFRTFAAPRSEDYFPSFMFFLTCSLTNLLVVKVFQMMLSLVFPETIESLSARHLLPFNLDEARNPVPIIGAMMFGVLHFILQAGVLAATLHLFVLILHKKRKGFTVSFQLACYSQGICSLLSMAVSVLYLGISMAGPAAATVCLWAGGAVGMAVLAFGLFLLFAGLVASHKMGRVKAALAMVLFIVVLALWLAFAAN